MAAYAKVVLDTPATGLDKPLDYLIPNEMADTAVPGVVVDVPLGRRTLRGWIVAVTDQSDLPPDKLRPVNDVLPECGQIRPGDLALAKWIAQEYCASLSDALPLFAPPGSGGAVVRRFVALPSSQATQPIPSGRLSELFSYLCSAGRPVAASDIRKAFGKAGLNAARALVQRGLATLTAAERPVVHAKERTVYTLNCTVDDAAAAAERYARRAPQRAATLRAIIQAGSEVSAAAVAELGGSPATLKDLTTLGIVEKRRAREWRDPLEATGRDVRRPNLNPAQALAVAEIGASVAGNSPGVFLLHGVTGSGKTEVYLQAVDKALSAGKGAILLVPEIALTPQTAAWFRGRFGRRVAILHSRLSGGERFDEWTRIEEGEASVVLGTRSAVFAPVRDLGLIIVDEEHEGSYKQEDAPRYHAREVAVAKAGLAGATVVLGSATPAVDTYFAAQDGRYRLLELRERATGGTLPAVTVVDMRRELADGNRTMFSTRLRDEVQARLLQGEQTILFLNRRGYARVVLCRACGLTVTCPYCGVAMTFHAATGRVECHYCNHSRRVPDTCPECGSRYIRHFGIGTERVEEEVAKAFPGARIARLDIDSTRRKGAHAAILDAFMRGDSDILVGTQMVAKGLDFPNVTLVGVIAADTSLRLPDYAAAERTFQMLAQVAGRAGRGTIPGHVIIQTYSPDHYAIQAAARHDYPSFYSSELEFRRVLRYPPFAEVVLLTAVGAVEAEAAAAADEAAQAIRLGSIGDAEILGPTPAPLAKLRGEYRFQVIVKGRLSAGWQEVIKDAAATARARHERVSLHISVRPQSLL